MPITAALTLTSAVAVGIHYLYLRRTYLNREAQRARARVNVRENGDRLRIANALFHVETTRFLINLSILLAGVGLLAGFKSAGYLLVAVPFLSVTSSIFALRGIR
jgi:hypothetical protein